MASLQPTQTHSPTSRLDAVIRREPYFVGLAALLLLSGVAIAGAALTLMRLPRATINGADCVAPLYMWSILVTALTATAVLGVSGHLVQSKTASRVCYAACMALAIYTITFWAFGSKSEVGSHFIPNDAYLDRWGTIGTGLCIGGMLVCGIPLACRTVRTLMAPARRHLDINGDL
jgi:hypothetical protein